MSNGDFNPEKFNWDAHASDGDGYRVLPPGDYIAEIKNFKRTRERGKHQIDLTISVLASIDTGEEIDSLVWETLTIASNAIWRLADLCKAVGAPTTFNLNSDADVAQAIKGKLFALALRTDEWGGKKRNKVDRYQPMTSKEEAIADKLKLYSDDGTPDPESGGASGDSNSGRSSNEWNDDDIPF